MHKINLMIVEDHPFTRQTLVYEFKKQENINLVAALDNGESAINFVKTNQVDVILMDIDMPIVDGISATKEIKKFNDKILIIMLTNHNEKDKVISAFKSGANGYCIKQIKIDELLNIIDIVKDGGVWFDKQIAQYIFEILKNVEEEKQHAKEKNITDFNITHRERNILKLIADGYSNAQIANELVIAHNTVKNHVASIIKKLNVEDRVQIAVFALKNNLLE